MTTHLLRLFSSKDGLTASNKHCVRHWDFKLGPVALLLLALVVSINCQKNAPPSIESPNSINLNEILKHQQALIEECRQIESIKLLELKQLLETTESSQDDNKFHEPVVIKMPAVCLFLNGPPTLGASSDGSQNSSEHKIQPRLDLVNWLYDYDDLLDESQKVDKALANNKTKRHTGIAASGSLGRRGPLLDANRFTANDQELPNDIDSGEPDEKLFRAQLEQMIDDDRFQEAVRMNHAKIGAYLSPVILVPGLAGSRLQARVSKLTRVNIICKKQHDWQDLWLSLRSFLPIAIDCWIDNVRLEFDPTSGFVREPAGVETRVPDFGSIDSVRHLDLRSPKLTKYFDSIIERYLKIGYQADRNLFAVPYDFRLAPQQIQDDFFEPLRQLIDQVSTGNDPQSVHFAKKVTLVCHSMGCTHLLVFLRQQSSEWRQDRIRKVVALSSPWGGATKALKALLVGEQFNLPMVSDLKMRELTRTFPSVAYLLPQAEIYSKPTDKQVDFGGPVLVQTPQRNYRVHQLGEMFQEIGLGMQWGWFEKTASLIKPLEPLDDVHMDCLHGLNIPTIETILFRNQTDFPDGDYELISGNGDGTVNEQSLIVCADWARKLPHLIRHKVLRNTTHTGVLSNKHVLEYLTEDAATN